MYKTIKWQGKEYPIQVSFYALEMLETETGKRGTKDMTFYDWRVLFKHSLKWGHNKAGQKFTLKDDEILEMIDDVYMTFMEMIPMFFSEMAGSDEKEGDKGKSEKKEEKKLPK